MKGRFALLLSAAAGVVALMAVALYINARESVLLEQAALQDVVVATRDILANRAIDESVVQMSKVPRKYLAPGAITAINEAIGRIAAVPIPKGAQVAGTALQEGGREALAFSVPRGMRAVTLAVNDVSGVGGLIRVGNFVDIVGIFEYGVPSGSVGGQMTFTQEKTETLTIAQNVQVVAVGREFAGSAPAPKKASEAPPTPEEAAAAAAAAEKGATQNATLLVSPAQVQELVLAQHVGTLFMSLRSNLDAGQVVELGRLDPPTLLKVPTPVPLKPRPQGPTWREYRGARDR